MQVRSLGLEDPLRRAWQPIPVFLPAMQETQVQSLGQEDTLEKGMVTQSIFLPVESHGQRSLVSYSPQGLKELDMTEGS